MLNLALVFCLKTVQTIQCNKHETSSLNTGMLEFPLIEVNKLSKIYKQNTSSDISFESVESAKQFFLTAEALDQVELPDTKPISAE